MISGIKDFFGKFSVCIRWFIINVVCVIYLEFLRKERNRYIMLICGISGSMVLMLLFRFWVRKIVS